MTLLQVTLAALQISLVFSAEPLIQTPNCIYKGDLDEFDGVVVLKWTGIRYAQPPIGDLRFQPPQPFYCEPGQIIDATKPANQCPQILPELLGQETLSSTNLTEDCLQLNVWVPILSEEQAARSLPYRTLIVLPSGTFDSLLWPDERISDGKILAARGGIIVVTLNYRLGVFGFTYTDHPDAPGNQGLLDQEAALTWVRTNIRYFGGDPNLVTLQGQGAGSVSASLHLLKFGRNNLINRYILSSGFPVPGSCDDKATAFKLFVKLAELAKCREESYSIETSSMLSCLRSRDILTLLVAQNSSEYRETRSGYPKVISKPVAGTRNFEKCIYDPNSYEYRNVRGLNILMLNMEDEGSVHFTAEDEKLIRKHDDILDYFRFIDNRTEMFIGNHPTSMKDILSLYFSELLDGFESGLKEALIRMIGDRLTYCPSLLTGQRLATLNIVHRGLITFASSHETMEPDSILSSTQGARHGLDSWLLFGVPFVDTKSNDQDKWMSDELIKLISNFVKTEEIPWPPLLPLSNGLVTPFEYDLDIKKTYNPLRKSDKIFECKLWEPFIWPVPRPTSGPLSYNYPTGNL